MSSAATVVTTIVNIDHGLLGTCWPVLTETGGSTLGGVAGGGGPPAGLLVCETGVADVVTEPLIGDGDTGVADVVTEPLIGDGETGVDDGAGELVGGETVPLTGTTQVDVGKKRSIASETLKCTSTWTKHLPSALANSGTDSLVGPFGPIEKSRLS